MKRVTLMNNERLINIFLWRFSEKSLIITHLILHLFCFTREGPTCALPPWRIIDVYIKLNQSKEQNIKEGGGGACNKENASAGR